MHTSGVTKGTSFTSVAPKLGHQPAFDGMRGIFVLLVLLGHATVPMFLSFATIVDMFFVLSGFLITTLLLEEHRLHGRVSLRNFYKRRGLRLLPLLYITLGITLLGVFIAMKIYGPNTQAALPSDVTFGELWNMTKQDATAGGLYVYHVFFPVNREVVSGVHEIRPMTPLWSLSVEEHYYVFGVLLTIVAIKTNKVRLLMGGFLAAWLFINVARGLGHVGPQLAWYQRPDALLLGVMLAFFNAHLKADLSPRFTKNLHRLAWLAIPVYLFTVFIGTKMAKPFGLYVPYSPELGGSLHDGLYWGEFGFAICTVTFAVFVLAIVRVPNFRPAKLFCWGPAIKLGHRSYALYLIHVPLLTILVNLFVHNVAIAILLMLPMLALTTWLAHRFVETPLMQSKGMQSKGKQPKEAAPAEPAIDLTTADDASTPTSTSTATAGAGAGAPDEPAVVTTSERVGAMEIRRTEVGATVEAGPAPESQGDT